MGGDYYLKEQLGDVAGIIMGQSPPGSTYNEDGNGLPFFQGVRDFNYRHPSVRVFCSAPSRVAQPGDILLSVRAPIGRVNIADRVCCIGRGLSIVRAKSDLDQRFIEFVLRLLEPSWQSVEGGGSVFGNATKKDLENLLVHWPSPFERQAIAYILGSLDDKIELNRRMNKTLEAMARAIFKSWFVDFDPVYENMKRKAAKSQGRKEKDNSATSSPGVSALPADILDLFPDSFEDSELGEIPKGWVLSTIGSEFNLMMGQSPPGKTYNETGKGIPFFQGRRDFNFRYPSRRVFCTAPKRFAERDDTIVSVRAPVGDINMAFERCCIGRGVAAIRHKSGSRSYTYCAIHTLSDRFASFEADGTVFGAINKKQFEDLIWLSPDDMLVDEFEKIAFAIDEQVKRNSNETKIIASLRDTLLPKLISGELRVPDADKFVEEAGV
jgi:type I restriction enzyme, S subunit